MHILVISCLATVDIRFVLPPVADDDEFDAMVELPDTVELPRLADAVEFPPDMVEFPPDIVELPVVEFTPDAVELPVVEGKTNKSKYS